MLMESERQLLDGGGQGQGKGNKEKRGKKVDEN